MMDEPATTATALDWRRTFLTLVPALLLFAVQAIWLWNFSIDDAGISWRYALHLSQGHGLRWNLTGPPVEGYSNFLWVLLLGVFKFLGIGIEFAAHLLGMVFAIGDLCLLQLICVRLWPQEPYAWLPALLVAATPEWSMWSMSGLEIAMFGGFVLVAIWSLTEQPRISRSRLILGLCGLILTRPEGAAVGLAILGLWVAVPQSGTWRNRLAEVRLPLLALIVTGAGLTLFRIGYYGYPLPNTVYAKFSTVLPSWPKAVAWLWHGTPFWILGCVALWLTRSQRQFPILATGLGVVLVHTALTMPVDPVMNFSHRYHVALLPALVMPLPLALAMIHRRWRLAAAIVAGALVLWSAQGFPTVYRRWSREAASVAAQRCVIDRLLSLPSPPSIALLDAGRIPYWSDLSTTDVWGLCDAGIARSGFSADTVLSRHPDAYIISADSIAWGLAAPRLWFDRFMYSKRPFLDGYLLWEYCASSQLVPSANDSYGYAVLIETGWADRHAIRLIPHPPVKIQGGG
jgi:hypothetical protein